MQIIKAIITILINSTTMLGYFIIDLTKFLFFALTYKFRFFYKIFQSFNLTYKYFKYSIVYSYFKNKKQQKSKNEQNNLNSNKNKKKNNRNKKNLKTSKLSNSNNKKHNKTFFNKFTKINLKFIINAIKSYKIKYSTLINFFHTYKKSFSKLVRKNINIKNLVQKLIVIKKRLYSIIIKINLNILSLSLYIAKIVKIAVNKVKIILRKIISQFQILISKLLTIFNKNTKKITNSVKIKRFKYFAFGILFSLIFIFIPFEVYIWYSKLPKAELLQVYGNNKSTKILDRNDNLLYEIYVDKKYSPVSLNQIPQNVINATLAVEDSQFYNHNGIRPVRILKALQMTLFKGQKQGASTITQQLVKNVLLTNERTLSRKLKEAVITIFVESKYTKDEILELYLNNISYGGVAWGVQSASQKYYGLDVWELNLAQASMLAGLPSSPSIYSPLVNFELAKQRQLHVLNRMYETGYITQQQLDEAYNEELVFVEQYDYIRAPHFVHYVRDLLEKEYGKRFVDLGGLTIKTSLDLSTQQKVEQIISNQIEQNKYLNLTNGASIVLDVENSNILAYVGSVDYFQSGWGAFDIIQSNRQPGSSIKPVTYALALQNGYNANSILYDTKLSVPQSNGTFYTPVNYDLRYRGAVTLRNSLANSYNIPPVRLAIDLGAENIVALANEMGLKSWDVTDNYGISVTLGAKEVKLFEHANLYATFARQGVQKEISPFLSIKDASGNELFMQNDQSYQAISKDVSYIIYDILSDNNARASSFGYNSDLYIKDYKVAVKTGTTDEKRDNWTMGYNPNYVVGVWVGNNDNSPMNNQIASGLTGASTIWNEIFTELLDGKPNNVYDVPDGIFEFYDKSCNRKEIFIKGSKIPSTLCFKKKESTEDKNKNNESKDND